MNIEKTIEEITKLAEAKDLAQAELQKAKKELCAHYGHPRVITQCFGYIHCARCEEQIGDCLGGYFDGDKYVLVEHDCDKCRANWTRLEYHEKFLIPFPFKATLVEVNEVTNAQ